MAVRPPFTLAICGDSTFTGRFSADWVPTLLRELKTYPEAKGEIVIYNMGKGSQTSTSWGVPTAPVISALKPKYILTSGYELNGCVDFGGGPAVSRAQNVTNLQAMVAEWRANIPGVDITFMTQNPVSAVGEAIRPTLADYYADTVTLAATLETRILDNYGGVAGGPVGGWPKPLPQELTYGVGPQGYSLWDPAWAFNPADKNANVALAGGNLTVTSAVANCAVRGTVAHASGLYVVSYLIDDPTGVAVGIGGNAAALNERVGASAGSNAIGLGADGNIYYAGNLVGSYGALVAGDLISVVLNASSGLVWFCKNGTYLYGDPVLGTGGIVIAVQPRYPMVSCSPGGQVTGKPALYAPGDGLHPIWAGAVDTYLYPNVLAWARARMAEHWPA